MKSNSIHAQYVTLQMKMEKHQNILVCFSKMVLTSVVCVNGLGFTLCVSVNLIMKFSYTSWKCKCLISIYIHVSVKSCKSILYHVK